MKNESSQETASWYIEGVQVSAAVCTNLFTNGAHFLCSPAGNGGTVLGREKWFRFMMDADLSMRLRPVIAYDVPSYKMDFDPSEICANFHLLSPEQNVQLRSIDGATERLISQLDHSGSLDGDNTQRLAYELRLAVAQALRDVGRVTAVREALSELDGAGVNLLLE